MFHHHRLAARFTIQKEIFSRFSPEILCIDEKNGNLCLSFFWECSLMYVIWATFSKEIVQSVWGNVSEASLYSEEWVSDWHYSLNSAFSFIMGKRLVPFSNKPCKYYHTHDGLHKKDGKAKKESWFSFFLLSFFSLLKIYCSSGLCCCIPLEINGFLHRA